MKLFSKKSAEKAADESGMDKKITDDESINTIYLKGNRYITHLANASKHQASMNKM